MAYTPELNPHYSGVLRRIAWSLNKPMTNALPWVLERVAELIPKGAICEACKCTDCGSCPFSTGGRPSGKR